MRNILLGFYIILVVLFVLLPLLLGPIDGESKELSFSSTTTGTFFSGNVNTNADAPDFFPIAIGMVTAVSQELKEHTIYSQIEVTQPLVNCDPSVDPGMGLKSTLVQGSSIYVIPDQSGTKLEKVFLKITEITQCTIVGSIDSPPFPFVAIGKAEITGGTGKFKDASGLVEFTLEGEFSLFTSDPVAFYGHFNGTQSGNIMFEN